MWGLPEGTSRSTLLQLRRDIVDVVANTMGVKPTIVRPFFPEDLAGDPDKGQDNTIFVQLITGMFHGVGNPEAERRATYAIACVVWKAFDGKYEVEAFIGDLDNQSKTLIHPKV